MLGSLSTADLATALSRPAFSLPTKSRSLVATSATPVSAARRRTRQLVDGWLGCHWLGCVPPAQRLRRQSICRPLVEAFVRSQTSHSMPLKYSPIPLSPPLSRSDAYRRQRLCQSCAPLPVHLVFFLVYTNPVCMSALPVHRLPRGNQNSRSGKCSRPLF